MIDKTKEEEGMGYQILGAVMPKTYSTKNNKITFWKALTKDAKGFEKWFNAFLNGTTIIVCFIILLSLLYCLVDVIYNIVIFCIRIYKSYM